MAWPEAIFVDKVEQWQEAEISNIFRKAPQVKVWIVGAQPERDRQLESVCRDQCAGSTVG